MLGTRDCWHRGPGVPAAAPVRWRRGARSAGAHPGTSGLGTRWDRGTARLGTRQGWGHRYLLQQEGVPVALGQVVGGEGALDAGPDDDGIVGGVVGLAGGSHLCPRPCPRPRGQLGTKPRGGKGQSPAETSGWQNLGRPPAFAGVAGAASFPPLGAGRAAASPYPHRCQHPVLPGKAARPAAMAQPAAPGKFGLLLSQPPLHRCGWVFLALFFLAPCTLCSPQPQHGTGTTRTSSPNPAALGTADHRVSPSPSPPPLQRGPPPAPRHVWRDQSEWVG